MRKTSTKSYRKIALLFFFSYLLFLFFWFGIKDSYGMAFTWAGSQLLTFYKKISLYQLAQDGDRIHVLLNPLGDLQNQLLELYFYLPNFTHSIPVTFAIVTACYPVLKRKRIYFYVLICFFALDTLWVFFREVEKVSPWMVEHGLEQEGGFFLLHSDLFGLYLIMGMPFFVGLYQVLLMNHGKK